MDNIEWQNCDDVSTNFVFQITKKYSILLVQFQHCDSATRNSQNFCTSLCRNLCKANTKFGQLYFTNITCVSWVMNKWFYRSVRTTRMIYYIILQPLSVSSSSSPPIIIIMQWFHRDEFCMANKWDWIDAHLHMFLVEWMSRIYLFICNYIWR